ncbi:phosphoribosyltransferase family protein [Marinospirillum sp. MEB164]|uniref:Phosphoribosyltransferase family protein n=1 Tax=Marinospirillum alkalitolerans TaxID=3123374 RepID=A0ABW8PXJ5_9GAMM
MLCHQPVAGQQDLCQLCQPALPEPEPRCLLCAERVSAQATQAERRQPAHRASFLQLRSSLPSSLYCMACHTQPPSYAQLTTLWPYLAPLDRLLLRFKYQQDLTAGGLFLDWLEEKFDPQGDWVLISIPPHRARQRQRGIDPPGWIARRLGWMWQRPYHPQWLMRIKETPSQQKLSRRQRLSNPQGAFLAHPAVQGQSCLLIDDVVTTGSTLHWAAQALIAAGAQQVEALALVKVDS